MPSIVLETQVVREITVVVRHDKDGPVVVLSVPDGKSSMIEVDLTPAQAVSLGSLLQAQAAEAKDR